MEGDTKVKSSEPVDAAALIAEALKRKFAHRYRHNSGDKEELKFPIPNKKPQTETPMVREDETMCFWHDQCHDTTTSTNYTLYHIRLKVEF